MSIRKLFQLQGKLQAATRAVPLAPLFFRNLQQGLKWGLDQSGQDYWRQLTLSTEEQEELQWWVDHLSAWNGKTIMMEKPSVIIESDVSTCSWGATYKGVHMGGPWSPGESQWHIYCLEALAAFHTVKCFVRDRRSATVLLRLDNISAISYVNKLGGTVLPQAEQHCERSVATLHEQRHHSDSRTPTGYYEHSSGRGVASNERSLRLDAESSNIPLYPSEVGATRSDPVCIQTKHPTEEILLQLETRPRGRSPGCIKSGLDHLQGEGLCQPPTGRRVLNEVRQQKVTLFLIPQCGRASHGTQHCWR